MHCDVQRLLGLDLTWLRSTAGDVYQEQGNRAGQSRARTCIATCRVRLLGPDLTWVRSTAGDVYRLKNKTGRRQGQALQCAMSRLLGPDLTWVRPTASDVYRLKTR
jgi:hypothetical protein